MIFLFYLNKVVKKQLFPKISALLGQIKIVALEKLIQSDRNVEEAIFNGFKCMGMSSILKIMLCFSAK